MSRSLASVILRPTRLQRRPSVVLPPAWWRGTQHGFFFSWAAAPHTGAVGAPQRGEPAKGFESTRNSNWLGSPGTIQAVVALSAVPGAPAGEFSCHPAGYARSAAAYRGLLHLFQTAGGGG